MGELDKVIKALNKKYGENYISEGVDFLDKEYKRKKLGIFALDLAIGGGIPDRKVMMIAGKPSSGKTTTMLIAIAEVQKNGGVVSLIDVEHNLDPIYAAKLGVDLKKLIYIQAVSVEQVSDTLEPLVMTGEVDLICIDSIAAAPSEKELEESVTKGSMGGKAKVIGLMMSKLNSRLNDVNNPVKTSILILNQIREKIGVMYGSPDYTPGGTILHHLSDIIVWLRPESEPVGGKDNPQGITTKFKVTKNRTFQPFKAGKYELLSCRGVNNVGSIIDLAITYGIITRAGAYYQYGETKGRGMEAFKTTILKDKSIIDKLEKEVIEAYKKPSTVIDDNIDDLIVNTTNSDLEE